MVKSPKRKNSVNNNYDRMFAEFKGWATEAISQLQNNVNFLIKEAKEDRQCFLEKLEKRDEQQRKEMQAISIQVNKLEVMSGRLKGWILGITAGLNIVWFAVREILFKK